MKTIFRILPLIAVFSVTIITVLLAIFKIHDPDTVQYIANGKYMLSHGLIRECVFTYSLKSCPVNYTEWLFYIATYLVFSAGGYSGMVLFQAGIVTALVFSIYLANWFARISPLPLASILLPAMLVASERFMLRSDLFSLVLFAVMFILVRTFDTRLSSGKARPSPWLFISAGLLQVLWVNAHGSFPFGILIVLSFAAMPFLKSLIDALSGNQQTSGSVRHIVLMTVLLAIVLLASLCNPYGLRAFLWPFFNILGTTSKDIIRTIAEYESPFKAFDFFRLSIFCYKVLLGTSLFLFLANIRRIRTHDVLIIAFTAYLSTTAIRYIALFAVACALILPYYLQNIFQWIKHSHRKLKILPWLLPASSLIFSVLIMVYCFWLGQGIITNEFYIVDRRSRQFGLGISPIDYPIDAATFIQKNHIAGNMFNSYRFGGYLLHRLYPEYTTFMHGSVLDLDILETIELYKYYKAITQGDIPFQESVQRFGINFFVLDHSNKYDFDLIKRLAADPEWKLVYLDSIAVIFVSNAPQNQLVIQQYAINVLDKNYLPVIAPGKAEPGEIALMNYQLGSLFTGLELFDKARYFYEQALKTYPKNVVLQNNLALIYKNLRLFDKAIELYKSVIAANGGSANVHLQIGLIYAQKQMDNEALAELTIARKLNPRLPNVNYSLGYLFFTKGKKQEAAYYFREELRYHPDHKEAKAALSSPEMH